VPFSSDTLRERVVAALADRLDSDVELERLSLRIFPTLHAEGNGLTIRHQGRQDVPPLIAVSRFTIDADLVGLWRRKVAKVKLDGLTIHIPPDDDDDPERPVKITGEHYSLDDQVVVDKLEADDAQLIILRREAHKTPRVWALHRLRLSNVSANTAMPFEATLTNAVPPGRIDTEGAFGPWHRDDPGHTPVQGSFVFNDADLSVFKGISGMLSAHGVYEGTLETLDVEGTTDTPDFMVNLAGHKVPLQTKYHALVNATNGNTVLERIDATFLDTSLVAKGGVYEIDGLKGRLTVLDVEMTDARLEDVMKLAVKTAQPPMTGGLKLQTRLELPPGDKDVIDKLELDGRFAIEDGRFTNADVQRKINELSYRASARKAAQPPQRVPSDFAGRFILAGGALNLRSLAFDVPGAMVQMNGRYNLQTETLAFTGSLVMDAKVSQTMTGWKSFLLKAVDPLFRKEGKTVIPLKISGTRDKPSFGLDYKRVF
jgi:hypothetical protein